jgi:hypothetical protein
VPPPKSENPGAESSYLLSFPNKKNSFPLCIVVGKIPAPIIINKNIILFI